MRSRKECLSLLRYAGLACVAVGEAGAGGCGVERCGLLLPPPLPPAKKAVDSKEFMMRSAFTCDAGKVIGTTLHSVVTNSAGSDSSVVEKRAT